MARVLYSAEINEMKGSIGGTTFQRNKAGTIARLKPSLVFRPTYSQLNTQLSFGTLVSLYQNLSFTNKALWNAFAASYTKTSYWGIEKSLTGFNWFLSINRVRISCGVSYTPTPPNYVTPLACPKFKTLPLSSGLYILFESFPQAWKYHLLVFATPPIRQPNSQARKSLRLIGAIQADQLLSHDLTSLYESAFNTSWPWSGSTNDYNILVAVSLVDSSTYISGQLYLDVAPLNLSFNPLTYGSSFSETLDLPTYNVPKGTSYIGNGIFLTVELNSGHVYRSSDYGSTWSNLGQLGSTTDCYGFASDFAGNVVAGMGNPAGIYVSNDWGLNFTLKYTPGATTYIYAVHFVGNGVFLAAGNSNTVVFRSVNSGENWSTVSIGSTAVGINSFCNSKDGRIIAVSGSVGKTFYSDDFGASWNDGGALSGVTFIYSVVHIGDGVLLASVFESGHIWRSTDNGLNWSYFSNPGTSVRSLVLRTFLPGQVYCGSWNTAILYLSNNFGSTWSSMGSVLSQVRIYSMDIGFYKSIVAGTFNQGKVGACVSGLE